MALKEKNYLGSEWLGANNRTQNWMILRFCPAPIVKPHFSAPMCFLFLFLFPAAALEGNTVSLGRNHVQAQHLFWGCVCECALVSSWMLRRYLLAVHGAPFLEGPNCKAFISFQIMNLRPQGHRSPPGPPPRLRHPRSSRRMAPSAPFLEKSSIWLERNDLLVSRTFLTRETWVFNFSLWGRA